MGYLFGGSCVSNQVQVSLCSEDLLRTLQYALCFPCQESLVSRADAHQVYSSLAGGLSLESASAADDDEGGHVDLLPEKFALQEPGGIGPEELFSIAANVFRYEYIPLATDIQSAYELPVASLAAGIVKGDRHLKLCRQPQAALYLLPRSEKVAEADHGDAFAEGQACGAGGGSKGCDAGHNLHRFRLRRHLQAQPGHAVDIRVSAAHQSYRSLAKEVYGRPDPVYLLSHAAGEDRLAGQEIADQVQIRPVADHKVCRFYGLCCGPRAKARRARADSHDGEFVIRTGLRPSTLR